MATRAVLATLFALLGLSGISEATEPVGLPVYLDHVMVTVEPAVYEAINSSEFLRGRFASVVIDTITATDDSWIGTYVSGSKTYIEFFSRSGPEESLTTGVGFSVERSGGVALVESALSERWGERVQAKLRSTPEMPCYYHVSADTASDFASWVMEYHEEFTDWVRGSRAGTASPPRDGGPLRREEMLALDFDPGLMLGDIIGVDVALEELRRSAFIEELRLYGYDLSSEGDTTRAVGPGATLRVAPVSGARRGVCSIRMRLLTPPRLDERRHAFGNGCEIVLTDTEAIWTFGE